MSQYKERHRANRQPYVPAAVAPTRDSGTDRAGYLGATFDCDALIDFPLASAAKCVWTTSDTLTATLDHRATCIPDDNITVLGGLLKPYCSYLDCSCWPHSNASGPVQIARPDVPLTPVAVFVGSQSIGSCSDVDIDLTTSIGSGGRDWSMLPSQSPRGGYSKWFTASAILTVMASR